MMSIHTSFENKTETVILSFHLLNTGCRTKHENAVAKFRKKISGSN